MFEFNAECYGILQVHPDQASRPRYHVVDWSDTYFKKKLSVLIVFLVNDGLFEHFLIKKTIINVEIREIENIQILFWTHVNVLFRTCYRVYSYVKFKKHFPFFTKNNRNPQKGAWWFHWERHPCHVLIYIYLRYWCCQLGIKFSFSRLFRDNRDIFIKKCSKRPSLRVGTAKWLK